jgi:hypothetical protein
MSRRDSDSFLPGGSISSPPHSMPPSSTISPLTTVPRSMLSNMDSYVSPHNTSRGSSRSPVRNPKTYTMQQQQSSHSPSQNNPLNPNMTPPKTRSSSTDPNNDALIQDWRNYTNKLRGQFDIERAQMNASRQLMEEAQDDERRLWDTERAILQRRIKELERQLESRGRESVGSGVRVGSRDTSMTRITPGLAPRQSIQQQALSFNSPGSNPVSVTGSVDSLSLASRTVPPQESGRNPDGSRFYAPTTRNPSRTFSPSAIDSLRVDDISAPRESAIRVTSKELTPSDFGLQSPPSHALNSALDTIPETESTTLPESIDISLIQPELEGVTIKTSAVSPTFAAKVLSPSLLSPAKLSPDVKPPGRDITSPSLSRSTSQRNDSRESGKGKADLSVMMTVPVDKRLRMHAGHTPNHSVTKFDFIESGGTTPTQQHSQSHPHPESEIPHVHRAVDPYDGAGLDEAGYGNLEDEDRSLTGQLGLTNDKTNDEPFLAQLTQKLAEEARKSEGVSPSSEASEDSAGLGYKATRAKAMEGREKERDDGGPRLRLKQSSNFGRPLGSM